MVNKDGETRPGEQPAPVETGKGAEPESGSRMADATKPEEATPGSDPTPAAAPEGEPEAKPRSGIFGDVRRKAIETALAGQLEEARKALEVALAERDDMRDRMIRAVAEADNVRKRAERERIDYMKYAAVPLARDVLSLADNIDRAITAVPPEAVAQDSALKGLVEGVEILGRDLHAILARHGVKPIMAEGAKFDPNFHQAMMEIEDPDVPAGHVAQVFFGGYMLEDRVLRPAAVAVSRGGPKVAAAPTATGTGEAPTAAEGSSGPARPEGSGTGQTDGDSGSRES